MKIIRRYACNEGRLAEDNAFILDIALKENKLLIVGISYNKMLIYIYDINSGVLLSRTRLHTSEGLIYYRFICATERGFVLSKPHSEIVIFKEGDGIPVETIRIGNSVPDILYNGDFIAAIDGGGTFMISNLYDDRCRTVKTPRTGIGCAEDIAAIDLAMESMERQYALYRLDKPGSPMKLASICKHRVKCVWSSPIRAWSRCTIRHPFIKCLQPGKLLLHDGVSTVFNFDDSGNIVSYTDLPRFTAFCQWTGYIIGVPWDNPGWLCANSGQTNFVLDDYKEKEVFDVKSLGNIMAVRLKGGEIILYEAEPEDRSIIDHHLALTALSSM